jgi:hypothetical protein
MRQSFSVPPFQTRGSSHTMENLLTRPAVLARRSTWTNLIRICHSSSLTELADARMSATNSSRTKVSMGAVWARQVLLVTIVSIAITRTAASNQLPPEAAAAAEVGTEELSWGSGFSTYSALKEVVLLRSLFYLHLWWECILNFFWLSSAGILLADRRSRDRESFFLHDAYATGFWDLAVSPLKHASSNSTRTLPEHTLFA